MTDTNHNEEKEALQQALNHTAIYRGIQLCTVAITRADDWLAHDDGTVTGPGYTTAVAPSPEVKALIDASMDPVPPIEPPPPPAPIDPPKAVLVLAANGRTVTASNESTGAIVFSEIAWDDGSQLPSEVKVGESESRDLVLDGTRIIALRVVGPDGRIDRTVSRIKIPAAPPVDVPPPDDTPTDPPADGSVKAVSQTLTADKPTVMVGDYVTITGVLTMSDGTTKPITSAAFGWDKNKLSAPNAWTSRFLAIAPGDAKISNSNSGTVGRVTVTVIANDGTVFPTDPPPVVKPHAPPAGSPAPPAPSVVLDPPPSAGTATGPHLATFAVTDAQDRVWSAQSHVGDDAKAPADYMALTNDAGEQHPALTAWFYANGVEAGACRCDNAYDWHGFKSIKVTYDRVDVPVPPSSYPDGTFDFHRGPRTPMIEYGVQTPWSADKIDRALLPSFTTEHQVPVGDSEMDYSFNGLGCAYTPKMGTAGDRGDIGYMPTWNMPFILTPNDETWGVVRRADNHDGIWSSVFFCMPDTGRIIDVTKYPDATTLPPQQTAGIKNNPIAKYKGSYRGDTLTEPTSLWNSSSCPFVTNSPHLTGYALLSAMITGNARDMDHASFWTNYPLMEQNPAYTHKGGVVDGSPRKAAWCLRNLYMSSYNSSDATYFKTELDRNLAILLPLLTSPLGLVDTDMGYAGKGDAEGYKGLSLWMQNYWVLTCDAMIQRLPEWIPVAQFFAKFTVAILSKVYAPTATIYNLFYHAPDGSRIADIEQLMRASMLGGYTADEIDSVINAPDAEAEYNALRAHATRTGEAWYGKYADGSCDFLGYVGSSTDYGAQMVYAAVCAVNCGAPGADAALAYVQALPTKPSYIKDFINQKFHLTRRSA